MLIIIVVIVVVILLVILIAFVIAFVIVVPLFSFATNGSPSDAVSPPLEKTGPLF